MSNSVFLKPDENGNWGKIGTDAAGSMSEQLIFQNGATALGDGTAVDVSGYNTLLVVLSSTGSAVVTFEYSNDNTTWNLLPGQIPSNTLSNVNLQTALTVTTATSVRFNILGIKYVRFRISTYTSGAVTVIGNASSGSFTPLSGASLSFGNSDTNGTNNTLLGVGAYNLLFDGTNWVRQRSTGGAGDGSTSNALAVAALSAFNGTSWDRVRSINTGQLRTTLYNSVGTEPIISQNLNNNDALNAGSALLGVAPFSMGFAGTTWDRVRVGKVYRYIEFLNLTNGSATTVWTPAAGRKFRLMGISIQSTQANNVHLRDGAGGTVFSTFRFTSSEAHLTFDFGNGYLSSTANNVLEILNNTTVTASFWVTAWGTEE